MMKILSAIAFVFLSLGTPLQAAENAYDVLGKTLAPFVNLFLKESKNPNRAMNAELRIIDAAQLLDEQSGRVLYLKLMHELARSLGIEDWTARLWVTAEYKPAKIEIHSPQGGVTLAFDKLEFSPSLPPDTWKPLPNQTDVTHL